MVPVVLLTGFLGSGKTSLLNRLLATRPESDRKWALVVNELGEVGIDGDLLPASRTQQVELPGGCICCVLNEDLDKTLIELAGSEPDLDVIVIETTGVAEPLPISWSFQREPLESRFRLAAVVTVVDALAWIDSRSLAPAVDTQVEYADILVVSKLDVAGGEPPDALIGALRALNDAAVLVTGTPDEVAATLWTALADPPESMERPGPDNDQGHGHGHRHGPGFDAVSAPIAGVLDFEELADKLEELPPEYVRIKGIATVIDATTGSTEPRRVAFHRVGTRVSSEVIDSDAPARVVALGPGVELGPLAACVEAAMVGSQAGGAERPS